MKVQILQVPYDSAHRNVRMGSGPVHFIESGIAQTLHQLGYDVEVDCIEAESPFRAEIKTAFELYRQLAARVRSACEGGKFPLILSGNCNCSLGTIAGVGTSDLGIVWFDGHGDFNTPDTTVSGFLDGMGLATIAGLCWKGLAASIAGFHSISGRNIIHVGARDFSAEEKELFDLAGVAVVGAETIRRSGLREALESPFEVLRARVGRIYLHFDLDVLDPEETPANEFAPPDGLTVEQVEESIQMIGERFGICACGIASYDPRCDDQNKTLEAGVTIIKRVLEMSSR